MARYYLVLPAYLKTQIRSIWKLSTER
jgi:hypothetical protein